MKTCKCGSKMYVRDTRTMASWVRRRHECENGHLTTTYEVEKEFFTGVAQLHELRAGLLHIQAVVADALSALETTRRLLTMEEEDA